ncbi:MAG TPA: sigma-70 family RNA polymerase sigma factor [Bryobacteraceae bacterium]|nr:sigma-70 family RNA polymerase sigma factor [Bryobacteraceae bacterium]
MPFDSDTAMGGPHRPFPTTRHSLIVSAASAGTMAREALDDVVAVYWKPAYKHVRIQWRRSNEEAKDLVQGFFTALIEQQILAGFDPSKARFRTYLKGCLDHFVMKQDERANRLKRGGGAIAICDFEAAEREIAGTPSVEDVFLREWQRQMFALALEDLRAYCETIGKTLQYAIFAAYDLAEAERPSYAELAAQHGVPVTNVTNYLAWARRELRRMVLLRLSSVTSGDSECMAEQRVLFGK